MPLSRTLIIACAAIVLGGGLGAPAIALGARPAVQIGANDVIVTASSGARAVVSRKPFGLTVTDASGRTVLRELSAASAPAVPSPVAPVSQLEFGLIGSPPATRYAPLSFLVGTQTITQTPSGQWEGTLASVTETGVEYSAQSVVAVQQQGRGVVLTLSTNDPSGRKLLVSINPGSGDALSVDAHPVPSTGVAAMSDSFQSSPSEAFHGFGGRHNSLDQHGNEFYNWLDQENISSGSAGGLTPITAPGQDRYMFPNGPEAAYYEQASLVSSSGYGFLLDQDDLSHWRMDSDRPDAWQVEAGAPELHYTVIAAGHAAQTISQLTSILGRQPVAPAWAVGSQFDREVKYPSDPAAQYAQEVQSDIDNIRKYIVHVDGYRLEGWAELSAPALRHLIDELRAMRIHPLLYFRAFVGTDSTGTDDPSYYDYAIAHRYVATTASGSPYTFISNFNAPAAVIDFSNPAAVRWWQSRITAALDLGADGFMQDFGEQVLTGMHFHDGLTGAQMHNLLPVLYDHATRDAIGAYEHSHPGRQIFFFTRAGYSGAPGDAAYENANFPGDETTDWSRASGLASLTTDMLSRAIGGAYGYSTDIGGYFDIGPYQPTSKELFIRWAEWAALSPLFRLHGSLLAGVHTPWSYDTQTLVMYKQLVALHRRARPLIMELWRQADRTGIPITRPLWLAYPSDPQAAEQDQEWLLGPDVLVAPVVTEGATSRQVYFPSGCWVRPDTGMRFAGPGYQTVPAALDQLPYFFRCGTTPFAANATGRCPAPRGRLSNRALGPVRLGEKRAAVRRGLADPSTRHAHVDFFCLSGGGIRVGYPSQELLRPLGREHTHRLTNRVVLILTANHHYALHGIRPATRLRSALHRIQHARRYRLGGTTWYLMIGRTSTAVLKIERGRIEEIGVANRALTTTPRNAKRFLASFE